MVRCPECGMTCDVEELAGRYRHRWSTTPLYERMIRPVLVALLLVILAPMVWVMMLYGLDSFIQIGLILLAIFIGVLSLAWLALSLRAMRGLPMGRGWKLLFMLHATMAGYFLCGLGVGVGLIGLIMLPVAVINAAADDQAVVWCALVTVLGIVSALLFRPLWKLDQHVGRACLRHSLHEPPGRGSSDRVVVAGN